MILIWGRAGHPARPLDNVVTAARKTGVGVVSGGAAAFFVDY
jgi:hypothetical protein